MINSMIFERKKISCKLKAVSIIVIGNVPIIKKDENRLGKRKYEKYLALHYRRLQLKLNINCWYGLKCNEANMALRFQQVRNLPTLALVNVS